MNNATFGQTLAATLGTVTTAAAAITTTITAVDDLARLARSKTKGMLAIEIETGRDRTINALREAKVINEARLAKIKDAMTPESFARFEEDMKASTDRLTAAGLL